MHTYTLRSIDLLSFIALSLAEVCFSSRWSIVEEGQRKMTSIHYSLGTSSAALATPPPLTRPRLRTPAEQLQLRHPSDRRGRRSKQWLHPVRMASNCHVHLYIWMTLRKSISSHVLRRVNRCSMLMLLQSHLLSHRLACLERNLTISVHSKWHSFVLVCVFACGWVRESVSRHW